jgi:hypothetical protein
MAGMRKMRGRLEEMMWILTSMTMKGWTEADMEKFRQELEKWFAESTEKNTKVEMTAWIAEVRK